MSDWSVVFLAVMALSLVIMAAIQVVVAVMGLRMVQQVSALTTQLHQEVRPLIQKVNAIADDASRATALAAVQVERVDQLMATSAKRLDATMGVIQNVIAGPIGQGAAAVSAVRAVIGAVRDWKGRRRRYNHDDDDALFVG